MQNINIYAIKEAGSFTFCSAWKNYYFTNYAYLGPRPPLNQSREEQLGLKVQLQFFFWNVR